MPKFLIAVVTLVLIGAMATPSDACCRRRRCRGYSSYSSNCNGNCGTTHKHTNGTSDEGATDETAQRKTNKNNYRTYSYNPASNAGTYQPTYRSNYGSRRPNWLLPKSNMNKYR